MSRPVLAGVCNTVNPTPVAGPILLNRRCNSSGTRGRRQFTPSAFQRSTARARASARAEHQRLARLGAPRSQAMPSTQRAQISLSRSSVT